MGTASRSQNLKEHEVTFNDDEFLLEVFGRSGAAIDQIGFTTTKSSYSVIGGYGGSPFSLKASAGSYISSIAGGVGQNLDYILLTDNILPGDLRKFSSTR